MTIALILENYTSKPNVLSEDPVPIHHAGASVSYDRCLQESVGEPEMYNGYTRENRHYERETEPAGSVIR